MEAWELGLAAAASFVAALLGGAVGLVLGSLRLPAILLASSSPAAAAGANIAVSAAAALTGGVAHWRAGRVDWRIAAWMTPPSVAAAFLGGYFGGLVPDTILLGVIAAVLAWNGLQLLVALRTPRRAERPRLAAVVAGAVIGVVGGAVGLILGTLRMPALLGSVGLDARLAVGTNLVVGFFLGVSGFAGHAARLEVDWSVLAVSLAAAVPGAWLGARLTGKLSEEALKRAIGATLLVVAVAIAVEAAV
ncbi:MAG TPA: sulfite exporter TauE/SafE family protein [Gaiellaceae bacterium]